MPYKLKPSPCFVEMTRQGFSFFQNLNQHTIYEQKALITKESNEKTNYKNGDCITYFHFNRFRIIPT